MCQAGASTEDRMFIVFPFDRLSIAGAFGVPIGSPAACARDPWSAASAWRCSPGSHALLVPVIGSGPWRGLWAVAFLNQSSKWVGPRRASSPGRRVRSFGAIP
jgi:hypothetical protein